MGLAIRFTRYILFIYMDYIHPELKIGGCRSGSGKGAKPL